MGFVGFYDKRDGDDEKIYIGEYVSNADIFPCGEIKIGKGQCGQCVTDCVTLIAFDTKKLENYIPCDMFTRSEIVVPCMDSENPSTFRTMLDIDSVFVGQFTQLDQEWLENIVYLVYKRPL